MRTSWVAIRGMSAEAIIATLPFERVSETKARGEQVQRVQRDHFTCIEGRDGWFLVIAHGMSFHPSFGEGEAKLLSRAGEALYFTCETYAMTSRIVAYTNGEFSWSVSHGEPSPGGVPTNVERRIAEGRRAHAVEVARQEADEDYQSADYLFEVALAVGEELTGFHPEKEMISGTQTLLASRVTTAERVLSVTGKADVVEPSLYDIAEALSALAISKRIRLSVRNLGSRRQLSAGFENGDLRVEVLAGPRYLATRVDGSAVQRADLEELFGSFHLAGERSPRFMWRRM